MFKYLFVLILAFVVLSYFGCKKEGPTTSSSLPGGQWVQIDFPPNESVVSFTANGSILFAVSTTGFDFSVFRTTDGGANWARMTGIPLGSDLPMTVCFHGSTLILGTLFNILMSPDNGQTWVSRRSGITGSVVSPNLFVDGTNIFAATFQGLYVSSDVGVNWTLANNGLMGQVNSLAVSASNLFASNDSGVFKSTNYGVNWSRTNLTSRIYSIAVSGANLFAAIRDAPGGVYLSADFGNSWVPVNNGLLNANAAHTLFAYGNRLFAGTVRGVYVSSDNGANWAAFNEGFPTVNMNVADFVMSGTTMYAVFQGGSSGQVWKRALN